MIRRLLIVCTIILCMTLLMLWFIPGVVVSSVLYVLFGLDLERCMMWPLFLQMYLEDRIEEYI